MSNLKNNTAELNKILAAVNALPEAGSGEAPAPVLQEKSVTPSKEAQNVTPDTGYDGLSKVSVGAIPDEYIVPSGTVNVVENGEHNVREAEKVNVNVPIPEFTTQEKNVTPSEETQIIEPDDDHDGLSKVTVNPIPEEYIIPSGTKNITENGTHDVWGLESVNVNVPTGGGGDGSLPTETCSVNVKILSGHVYGDPTFVIYPVIGADGNIEQVVTELLIYTPGDSGIVTNVLCGSTIAVCGDNDNGSTQLATFMNGFGYNFY